MYAELPIISFVSAALALAPLKWYYRARNVAALAVGIWLSIASLIHMVDFLLWANDTDNKAPVWCDISTAFVTGLRIALPAACFSICIHLERLASFSLTSTPQAKRRRVVFEYSMCFGLPLAYIALHLIVQPRRFDLFYGFGCRPATYPTVVTIFLATIPPLLLAIGTIIYACIAWRHFIFHGVHFYGKKGSISSLTRNLYLRLVGMAVLEAIFSAIVISVVMWGILHTGLMPIGRMSRNLNEVRVWGPEGITGSVRTALIVEWSLTVVQSFAYFALFACRSEVAREGLMFFRSLLSPFKRADPPITLGQSSSVRSSFTGTSEAHTLPMTEVDLSLIVDSASTLALYHNNVSGSLNKPPLATMNQNKGIALRRPSVVEDSDGSEDVVIATLAPSMMPLESPSRASAIASSHNSLESNFDLSQLILSPDLWPQTPTTTPTVPVPARLSRRSFGPPRRTRYGPGPDLESWVEVGLEDVLTPLPPFPRAKFAMHARSCFADVFDEPEDRGGEKQQPGVYVTVVREIRG